MVTEDDVAGAIRDPGLASQLVGLPVRFLFKGFGFFDGTVTAFDRKEEHGSRILHEVTFSDGDREEYTYRDILRGHERYQLDHGHSTVVPTLQPSPELTTAIAPPVAAPMDSLPLPASFAHYPIRTTFGSVTIQGTITNRKVSNGLHSFLVSFPEEYRHLDHWIDLSTLHQTFDALKKEVKIGLPAVSHPELAPVRCFDPLSTGSGWTVQSPLVGLTVAARLDVNPFSSSAASHLKPLKGKREKKPIATATVEAVLPGADGAPEQYWGRIHGDLTLSLIFPDPQTLAEAAHVVDTDRLHQRNNRFRKKVTWLPNAQPSSVAADAPGQRDTIHNLGAFFQVFPRDAAELFGPGVRISARSVPKEALRDYRRGLGAVARLVAANPDTPEPWVLLSLFDALTLAPSRDFGRAIRRRVSLIFQGAWDELSKKHLSFRLSRPVAHPPSPLSDDPLDLIASRAEYHLSVNHSIRGASNALQAPVSPAAPAPGQVTATLRRLNPQAGDALPPATPQSGPHIEETNDPRFRRPILPPPSPPSDPISFTTAEVIRKVRRSNTSSAGGPSGTTYRTLRSWFSDFDGISDSLVAVINLIAAGKVPPTVTPFLNAGRGVAIPKNEAGDLRPIVVGHILLRLIGSLSMEKLKDAVLRYFLAESIQFGTSTADGCSLVATAIEAFLEKHPGTIDIASDAKNAFNSYCRSRFWHPLDENFPSISRFVRLMYGEASDILISEDTGTVSVPNSVGSRQGCSLGSFLFCLAIHPYLQLLQREYPDLLVVAYCDDVHIVGQPQRAIEAYHRWAYLYSCAIQGELRNDKGIVYSPDRTVNGPSLLDLGLPLDMPVTHDGVRILGAPVGTDAFCREFAREIIAKVSRDLDITTRMRSLQCQHVLTTKSTMHRVVFLFRNIWAGEPSLYDDIKATYDASLLNVVHAISRSPTLTDSARLIAHLPASCGGLGYRTSKSLSDPASLATYVNASKAFPNLFPSLADMVPPVQQLLAPISTPLSKRARMACSALKRIMDRSQGALEVITATESGPLRGVQHALSALLDQADCIHLLDIISLSDNPTHPRNKALFLSNQGDSHSWTIVPCDRATQVPNREFQTMVRRRLLLPTEHRDPFVRSWMCPSCQSRSDVAIRRTDPAYPSVDVYGDHALRCLRSMPLRSSLWHDPVVTVVNGLGRKAGFRMQIEAYGSIPDSNKRPDSFAVSPDGAIELAIDVRTCGVTCPTNCLSAARSPCYAADQGCTLKMRAWVPPIQSAGLSFLPFPVEEGGRLGDPCYRLLDLFSLSMNTTVSDKSAFKTYALQRIHLTNQRGVARIINALKPIPSDPHVVVSSTNYELAPPPPRPQAHASRAPIPHPPRPPWAATSCSSTEAEFLRSSSVVSGVP